MEIPVGATAFCPAPTVLRPGDYWGRKIRHTFRVHGTHDWLLIYTAAGSGLYRSKDGDEFRSRRGDVTLYRPGVFQDYQFCPEVGFWDLHWAHFLAKPDWLPFLKWPEKIPGLMTIRLGEVTLQKMIAHRLLEVLRHYDGPGANAQLLALNAFEEVLLRCDAVVPHRAQLPLDSRIAKAIDYLTARLGEPFSEDALAQAAGLSASRLRHLFREQVGDSPRHFQEQLRMRRAREWLATSRDTISEIAEELGFASPFYFTLRFKKETGESPRAFRQRTMGGTNAL